MTKLPIDIINRIMLLSSHPTAAIFRPLIMHTAWARYIHLNQGVRWLISDDAANVNSDFLRDACVVQVHLT